MTVVFLHPVSLDGSCWQFLTSPLLASALRYDLPWHGGREQPEETLSIEGMADDVAANTEGLLDLVGVSMGSHVIQQMVLRHPERVRSVVTTSSIAPPEASLKREVSQDTLDRAAIVTSQPWPEVIQWSLERWFTPDAIAAEANPGIAYVRQRLEDDSREQFAAGWMALGRHFVSREEQARSLVVPTTVVHSTRCDNSPLEGRRALAELLPNARLVVLEGPHMIHIENPSAFEETVLDHLDRVAAFGAEQGADRAP